MNKILFLDICGTLYDSNTTFDFLDFYLKNNSKYIKYKVLKNNVLIKLVNNILYKILKKDYIRKIGTFFLKNISEKEVEKNMERFYFEFLVYKKKEKVLEKVEYLKKQGYKIVLLSGTYDFIAKEIAKNMEADMYFGTELEKENLIHKGTIKKDLLIAKEEILKKYFLKRNDNNFIFITDNKTDKNLLKYMNYSYIVITKKNKKYWENLKKNEKIEFIYK